MYKSYDLSDIKYKVMNACFIKATNCYLYFSGDGLFIF